MDDDDDTGIPIPGTNLQAYGFAEETVLAWRGFDCDKHNCSGFTVATGSIGCSFCVMELRQVIDKYIARIADVTTRS
jgi:hypothetical protein